MRYTIIVKATAESEVGVMPEEKLLPAGPYSPRRAAMNIHEVFTYLCMSDAAAAIEFYRHAFGATERF